MSLDKDVMLKVTRRGKEPERIEGGYSDRGKLPSGTVLDFGTRDENGEKWNFNDVKKRADGNRRCEK